MKGGDLGKLVPSTVLQGIAKATYDIINKREPPAKLGTWFLFASSPTLLLYSNSEVKNKHIDCIVGIRGTNGHVDWEANLTLPFNALISSQRFKEDSEQMESWKQQIEASIPEDYDVAYAAVGHSLGGAIADEFLREGIISSALTFNAAIQPKDLGMAHEGFDVKRVYSNGDPLYDLMGKYADPPPKIIQLDGDLTHESASVVEYLQNKLARHKIRVFDDVGKGPDTNLLGKGKRRKLKGGIRASRYVNGLTFLLGLGAATLGGLSGSALFTRNPDAIAYLAGTGVTILMTVLGLQQGAALRLQEEARAVQDAQRPAVDPMPFPPPRNAPPVDVPPDTTTMVGMEEITPGMLIARISGDEGRTDRWYDLEALEGMWLHKRWFNPLIPTRAITNIEWRTARIAAPPPDPRLVARVPAEANAADMGDHVAINVGPASVAAVQGEATRPAKQLPASSEGIARLAPGEAEKDAARQANLSSPAARARADAGFQARNAKRVAEVEAMSPEERARRARELEEEAQALHLHGYGKHNRKHILALLQGGALRPDAFAEFRAHLKALPFMVGDPTKITKTQGRQLAHAAIEWIRTHSPQDLPRFEAAMNHYIQALDEGRDAMGLFVRAMKSIQDNFNTRKPEQVTHKKEFPAVKPAPSPKEVVPLRKPAESPPASPRVKDVVAAADSGLRLTEALAPRKGLGRQHKDFPYSRSDLTTAEKAKERAKHYREVKKAKRYGLNPPVVHQEKEAVRGVKAKKETTPKKGSERKPYVGAKMKRDFLATGKTEAELKTAIKAYKKGGVSWESLSR